jgi:hypothetical protein
MPASIVMLTKVRIQYRTAAANRDAGGLDPDFHRDDEIGAFREWPPPLA